MRHLADAERIRRFMEASGGRSWGGRLSFYHFDPYAQVLAKLERAHAQDLADVDSMLAAGLVERARALAQFEAISPELYRFPAVDPDSFRRRVEAALG